MSPEAVAEAAARNEQQAAAKTLPPAEETDDGGVVGLLAETVVDVISDLPSES